MRPYHVAEIYDPMTARLLPYPAIAEWLAQRLRAYSPDLSTILDIACGTGNLTLPLAQLGYRVTGLDVAPEMLAIARAKAAALPLEIEFVCQDMRQPYPGTAVDAVTCFYGGLNFLNFTPALAECFASVYQALKPGGLFAFEQFSESKMRTIFSGTKAADFGDFYAVVRSSCDDVGQIIHKLTFFLRNEEGSYRREEEEHHIRIHPLPEIHQLVAETGFALLSHEPIYPHIEAKLLQDVFLFIVQKPHDYPVGVAAVI